MAEMKTSDTVLIHRIMAAGSGKDIDDLRKYDLPQDRITQALATALANALDENRAMLLDMGMRAEELDPRVVD